MTVTISSGSRYNKRDFIESEFARDFDLSLLYNKDKRGECLQRLLSDFYQHINAIEDYRDFVFQRNRAVFNFIRGSEEAEGLNHSKFNLKKFLLARELLRNNYAGHCVFDRVIEEHPLIKRALAYALTAVSGDYTKLGILLTPGKKHSWFGRFDLEKHIRRTYLIHSLSHNHSEIIQTCEFLEDVVYAQGVQDWRVSHRRADYHIFGMRLLRQLRNKGILNENNPLAWIDKDFCRMIC